MLGRLPARRLRRPTRASSPAPRRRSRRRRRPRRRRQARARPAVLPPERRGAQRTSTTPSSCRSTPSPPGRPTRPNLGAGDFDCFEPMSTTAHATLASDDRLLRRAARGARLEPLLARGRATATPQSLFQKAGSDGFYWELGITVTKSTATQCRLDVQHLPELRHRLARGDQLSVGHVGLVRDRRPQREVQRIDRRSRPASPTPRRS